MPLPSKLQMQYLTRFDELICNGEAIHRTMKKAPGPVRVAYGDGCVQRDSDVDLVDWPSFVTWKTNCIALIGQVVDLSSSLGKIVESFQKIKNNRGNLEWGVATLKALKEDFNKGFTGDLLMQVETEIASDYMGQAESLLKEGQSGKYDHVPAAVLAGAVLEKALRTMCSQQNPLISTSKAGGEPKTLNPLIDDLMKANVFNEATAKQLRAWAAIRNHAAHGQFDQFTRNDVEQMLPGITGFLGDYLK